VSGVIPSGSIGIDAALGIGGLPRGRMVELFGPAGVGKSTLALQVIAAAQAEGQTAALVDVECTFDAAYARQLGVDVEQLVVLKVDGGEQKPFEIDQTVKIFYRPDAPQAVWILGHHPERRFWLFGAGFVIMGTLSLMMGISIWVFRIPVNRG
jgi:energy-coupling factor transporter ATP-binding protein EcfA2